MSTAQPRLAQAAALATALVAISLLALLTLDAHIANAATVACTTICTGTSGACNVSGTITITPGSTIDCTGRQVYVNNLATIKVEDGDMKLLASTLTIYSTGVMRASQVAGGGTLAVEIETTGAIAIYGSIQADAAAGGGSITIDAGGNVTIVDDGTQGIEANGTASGASGGAIAIRSVGSVSISNPVRAESAAAGEVVGGRITIDATTDVNITTTSGKVFVNGHKMDGGTIDINAGDDIAITTSAKLEANGRGAGGNGGGVYLTAQDYIDVASTISTRGGVGVSGSMSSGGSLEIESGCGGVRIAANLDLRGGELGGGIDGGSLVVDTLGGITVESGILIDAKGAGNGGPGGDVLLNSGGLVDLKANSVIDVRGDTSDPNGDGRGGKIEITGCEIDAEAGAKLDAQGFDGGTITLDAVSPATPQVTTLHLAGTSVIDTNSSVSSVDGMIRATVVNESLTGYCATNPSVPCTLDANCTVGCTPGDCAGLNPDTDNVLTQFKATPDLMVEKNLARCANECTP